MKTKPEWAQDINNSNFASEVVSGVDSIHDGINPQNNIKSILNTKKIPDLSVFKNEIIAQNRTILAQAITLIESNAEKHFEIAQNLITELLPYSGKSIRIGITGSPGAGKSTFIETFGTALCNSGHKVAVLAIDPSSTISRGSILGDKTRMENLARHKNAFIRPSPSAGNLGGVARKTRETIILCEAAGFDIIIIETVGVGQSEITVRSMVDFNLLLLLPLAGDELQGIKKGTVEIADALVINKADGDNLIKANITKENYKQALHYLYPTNSFWITKVVTCSALNETGINEIWEMINEYTNIAKENNYFEILRINQQKEWFKYLIEEELKARFYNSDKIKSLISTTEKRIIESDISPTKASKELIDKFLNSNNII